MKHKIIIVTGIILSLFINITKAEGQVLENAIYKESIRTVLLHPIGEDLLPPIIKFNTNERLSLSFDDLNGGYTSWQYTFIHCNADWTPTDLWQNEYLEGYMDDYIRDYRQSYNTLQPYTNYSIVIPNRNINIKIPGNYILKVYNEGYPETPAFTKRFMVLDSKVIVGATVRQSTKIENRFTHQEVGFSIFTPNYVVYEPNSNLKVVILQNWRWDNAIFNVKPLMLRNNEIDYNYTDGTIEFEGGNEFRFFDIKSLRFNSERVRLIETRGGAYYVDLFPDRSRAFKPYITEKDLNGRFLIKTDDGRNAADEAEYAWVNFFIPFEIPYPGGDMFVVGQFNDWKHDKSVTPELGRMKFNYARQGYEARLLLKQGYYNYLYAFVNNTGKIDFTQAESNHSQTGNQYTILVYNREQGERFDRLIAVGVVEK